MNEKGDYLNNMLSLENVQVRTVKLGIENDNTLIELLDFKSHVDNEIRNFYTVGASHLALTVRNIILTQSIVRKFMFKKYIYSP